MAAILKANIETHSPLLIHWYSVFETINIPYNIDSTSSTRPRKKDI